MNIISLIIFIKIKSNSYNFFLWHIIIGLIQYNLTLSFVVIVSVKNLTIIMISFNFYDKIKKANIRHLKFIYVVQIVCLAVYMFLSRKLPEHIYITTGAVIILGFTFLYIAIKLFRAGFKKEGSWSIAGCLFIWTLYFFALCLILHWRVRLLSAFILVWSQTLLRAQHAARFSIHWVQLISRPWTYFAKR